MRENARYAFLNSSVSDAGPLSGNSRRPPSPLPPPLDGSIFDKDLRSGGSSSSRNCLRGASSRISAGPRRSKPTPFARRSPYIHLAQLDYTIRATCNALILETLSLSLVTLALAGRTAAGTMDPLQVRHMYILSTSACLISEN